MSFWWKALRNAWVSPLARLNFKVSLICALLWVRKRTVGPNRSTVVRVRQQTP